MKFKKSLANLVITASLFIGGCAMPQRMDEYREHPEKYNSNYSAAILVAKPTAFYDYLAIPFMGIYEMRVANALKTKLGVDSYYFVRNAEWKDLESALLDDKIKVVVVAGHGDNYSWNDSEEKDIVNLFLNHPEIEKDWFIRHTCSLSSENHYMPRESIQKIQKELNEDPSNNVIDINWYSSFITLSYTKLLEEFKNTKTDEEFYALIKKCTYWGEIVIPKLTEELNKKIKNNYLVEGKASFGYVVLRNPSHVLGWDRVTTPLDFLLNPLPGLDEVKDKQ